MMDSVKRPVISGQAKCGHLHSEPGKPAKERIEVAPILLEVAGNQEPLDLQLHFLATFNLYQFINPGVRYANTYCRMLDPCLTYNSYIFFSSHLQLVSPTDGRDWPLPASAMANGCKSGPVGAQMTTDQAGDCELVGQHILHAHKKGLQICMIHRGSSVHIMVQ